MVRSQQFFEPLTVVKAGLRTQYQSVLYFEDVYFTDANNGVAVGWGGVIVRTTNGGANWIEPGHLTKTLTGVCFANSNVGIAVGIYGSVMKTTDGGATWNAKSSGAQANLYSVYFTSKDTGTAVGNAGRILHTTNGGTNWEVQTPQVDNLRGVYFSKQNKNKGIVVGQINQNGTILTTTDGGTNWNILTIGTKKCCTVFFLLMTNNGIVVGETGTILRTTDGGTNWTTQTSGTTNKSGKCLFHKCSYWLCSW